MDYARVQACVCAYPPVCARESLAMSRAYSPHFRSVNFSGKKYKARRIYLEYFTLKSLYFQLLASKIGFGRAHATRRSARTKRAETEQTTP